MTTEELKNLLHSLCQSHENEVVEFKQTKVNLENELGEYFSALSNEANLKKRSEAWLILGVEDKTLQIVGTNFYQHAPEKLHGLKHSISIHTTGNLTFIEIHEIFVDGKRVVMFQIPAAKRGVPTSYKRHWYGRDGESLVGLSQEKLERIQQQVKEDWSAGIVQDATVNDLSPEAINFAKKQFARKYRFLTSEIKQWGDAKFLDKAKLTRNGKITRTAIILLGNEESVHLLSPSVAQISWILEDAHGEKKDYEHFFTPFLLAVNKVYVKIRNLKYRYLQSGTLFPEEVDQYDPYAIREILHNCIAHQDYEKKQRIIVCEKENEQLIFINGGTFIPGKIEDVVLRDIPVSEYRNPFLANAMVSLNMIDTIGQGIPRIFKIQRKRFFPLPEYDLNKQQVKVTLIGKVLDLDYAKILARKRDLTLDEIFLLDKVQKKTPLAKPDIIFLRKRGLIEGRKPNIFISKEIAQFTDQKPEYSKLKAFDEGYYKDMLINALREHEKLSRREIDRLLLKKLPDILTDDQKKTKIKNLLAMLRENGTIVNTGTRKDSCWQLCANK